MTEKQIVFKVTDEHGGAHIARNGFKYALPVGKRAGKWMHAEGALKNCANGLHACRDVLDIGSHMNERGHTVWIAEAKGDSLEGSNKTAFESLRLLKRSKWCKLVAVAFAADCAERSLVISKWNDYRSWNAVVISRQIAAGNMAAYSAAYSAYSAAASAAVSAAYSAAAYSAAEDSAARSAYSACSACSEDSAAYSAYSAAASAARSAYSMAASAAYSAARSAYSAVSAARSKDSAAARMADSAARSADSAHSAEKDWQRARLQQYLEHGIEAMAMQCEGWTSTRGLATDELRENWYGGSRKN